MVDDFQPSRQKADLAEVVEMLLDKGVVLNADIAVSVGDTQLLGIQVRAALASFETAAKYGLEFPEGTDMRRVAEAAGEPELAEEYDGRRPPVDPTRGVNVTAEEGEFGREDGEEGEEELEGGDDGTDDTADRGSERLGARPDPDQPNSGDIDVFDDGPLDVGEDEDETDDSESESESDDQDQGQDSDQNEDEETATAETEGSQ
ncbi:gas vesicle protein GvpJ [Natronoglomus mannanivorans]|uniref:Gas vesicle protein n=1 Tax=Natronoglomus mannanivorans TaxID=2979990 RepID=A0AAP2YUW7_9EURY|nr:gas vesicle protein [Halobacteria archaeon AArc-xg1-1]